MLPLYVCVRARVRVIAVGATNKLLCFDSIGLLKEIFPSFYFILW